MLGRISYSTCVFFPTVLFWWVSRSDSPPNVHPPIWDVRQSLVSLATLAVSVYSEILPPFRNNLEPTPVTDRLRLFSSLPLGPLLSVSVVHHSHSGTTSSH